MEGSWTPRLWVNGLNAPAAPFVFSKFIPTYEYATVGYTLPFILTALVAYVECYSQYSNIMKRTKQSTTLIL